MTKVSYTPKFARAYKKLHKNQARDVDAAMAQVIENPFLGVKKSGDLNWLYVYKFKMVGQLTLLGYRITENYGIELAFVDVGSHENFYRDLKN